MNKYILLFWLILGSSLAQQSWIINYLDSLVDQHPAMLSNFLTKEATELKSKAVTPLAISPFYSREEWNNNAPGIVSYGIQTGDINPWEWKAEKEFLNTQVQSANVNLSIARAMLLRDALSLYAQWAIAQQRKERWMTLQAYLDTLYTFASQAYQIGQIDIIQLKELEIQIQQTRSRIINVSQQEEGFHKALLTLLQLDSVPHPQNLDLPEPEPSTTQSNPLIQQQRLNAMLQALELKRRTASFMPSLFAGYSIQTVDGQAGFRAIEIGISIPLNTPGTIKQGKAYHKQLEASQLATQAFSLQLQSQINQLFAQWQATLQSLNLYQTSINEATQKLLETYQKQLQTGAISPMDFIISYRNIINLNDEYFQLLEQERNLRIQLLFLTGKLMNNDE